MDGGRLKHIYLIRHCQASGQEPTARLTPEGYKPAKGLADFFAGIEIRKCYPVFLSEQSLRSAHYVKPRIWRMYSVWIF